MKYSQHLKKVFPETDLKVEDLLLLESFQIKYLPERVPPKEFSSLLRAYPSIHGFLIEKDPTIKEFLDKILTENEEIESQEVIKEHCEEVIWEIGELLIYNKHPEVYDKTVEFTWEINDIMNPDSLKGKVVADVGAGTGKLSLLLSKYAKRVYAIEPLRSFRKVIRQNIKTENIQEICVEKGFLNDIPLPDNSVNILFTSNALGWDFEKEQQEIERVVKPGGQAIHLMRAFDKDAASPYHKKLIEYNYNLRKLEAEGFKAKYYKSF